MDREGSIELIDAAVAVHTADGKVTSRRTLTRAVQLAAPAWARARASRANRRRPP
jgi:hypothetical protein